MENMEHIKETIDFTDIIEKSNRLDTFGLPIAISIASFNTNAWFRMTTVSEAFKEYSSSEEGITKYKELARAEEQKRRSEINREWSLFGGFREKLMFPTNIMPNNVILVEQWMSNDDLL